MATAPPPIPGCRKAELWDAREHLLMWVHTGEAHVRLADGAQHHVAAGTGIWLPPGPDHEMWTEPGTVAVPTWVAPHAVPDAPDHVVRFDVDPAARDWLIAQFVYAITRTHVSIGRQVSPSDLVTLLGSSRPTPPRGRGDLAPRGRPPLPTAAPARRVAAELTRNPALDYTIEEWAGIVSCSPNTLRRAFGSQCNMTFSQWRTLCRLAAAGELLIAGYDVAQVAARTGFASRSGLTRAFREHHGLTPREYPAQVSASRAAGAAGEVAARSESGPGPRPGSGPASPYAVLATQTTPCRYQYNDLSWIYRGEGWARVGEQLHSRSRGDAVWLPAGLDIATGVPDGSLALPIATLEAGDLQLTEPLSTHFPPSWDTFLLYCAVSANTLLRPEGYDELHILDVFADQLAAQRARAVPMPTDPAAHAAAADYLRRIGSTAAVPTGRAGAAVDVPDRVHEAFRRETGMSFASWRHAARMRIARDLLAGGAQPSVVAGRVGYTQVSNFSRAFSRFHGVSPREHQERERDALALT